MTKLHNFPSMLQDRQRYRRQINWIYQKYQREDRLLQTDKDGLAISDIYFDQSNVANRLADAISQGKYRLSPPEEKIFYRGGKTFARYDYLFLDSIVQRVLAEWLTVCSAVKERPEHQAIKQFRHYLHKHRDPHRHISLYALSASLQDYDTAIPVGGHSTLWIKIQQLLDPLVTGPARAYLRALLEDALRPTLITVDGNAYQNTTGIPTGTPIAALTSILYHNELDVTLGNIPEAFYTRNGNDFLFAHPNLTMLLAGEEKLSAWLAQQRLTDSLQIKQRAYITRAGKAAAAVKIKACDRIYYLDYVIHADGSIELNPEYLQKFLIQVRQRLQNCAKLLIPRGRDEYGAILTGAINVLLDVNHPLCAEASKRILSVIDNRGCLKQLDYHIALMVAELVAGIKGVRAWRLVPYKTVRHNWRLTSLCQRKNKESNDNIRPKFK